MHARPTLAFFLFTLPLAAQGGDTASPLLTDGHRVLAQFAGTWDCKVSMQVPGSAEPVEMTAVERASMVCSGLWLKSVVQSNHMGVAFEGLSVVGYESTANKYVGIWIDSQSPSVARSEGTFDAATKTLDMKTLTGEGPSRTVFTWKDADHSVEVGYAKGPDGKEVEILRIERTRASATPDTKPDAKPDARPTAIVPGTGTVVAEPTTPANPLAAVLRRLPGSWNCVMDMPDGARATARETVSAVCGGGWYWSDFNIVGVGRAFEGHALWGFDVTSNLFVSYWVDSASTGFTEVTGHYDEKTEVLTLHGHSIDGAGKKQRLHETMAWPTEHQRVLTMDFSTGTQNLRMTLTYERERSTGGYKIK